MFLILCDPCGAHGCLHTESHQKGEGGESELVNAIAKEANGQGQDTQNPNGNTSNGITSLQVIQRLQSFMQLLLNGCCWRHRKEVEAKCSICFRLRITWAKMASEAAACSTKSLEQLNEPHQAANSRLKKCYDFSICFLQFSWTFPVKRSTPISPSAKPIHRIQGIPREVAVRALGAVGAAGASLDRSIRWELLQKGFFFKQQSKSKTEKSSNYQIIFTNAPSLMSMM